jgi:hypothetical protein
MIRLTGLWIYQIFYRQKKRFLQAVPPIFIAIILVLSLGSNYILLTGDFNGWHQSYELPGDYADLLAYLEEQDKNYKSIWGPPYLGLNSTWSPDRRIIALEEQISPINTFSGAHGTEALNPYIYPLIFGMRFLYGSMVYDEQTNNLNEFLSPINVKYIVLHNDILLLKNRADKLSTALSKQEGLESKDFGFVTLYTLKDVAQQFSTKQSTMLIQGGCLLKFDSAFSTKSINSNNTGALFSDTSLDQNSRMWNSSDTLIPEKELSYVEYMLDKRDVLVLPPSAYTNDFAPLETWSSSPANVPRFLNELKKSRVELPYQFDYGKNIVFTSAKDSQLEIPVSVSNPGEYKVLSRYFANDKGGLLHLNLNEESLTLETKSHLNRFVWTDLGTLELSEGTQTLSITNRNGFNALNLIALVPAEKYDHYKGEFINSLENKDIIHIFEAESDFVSNETTPSIVRNIEYSNGKALELRAQDKASTRFEILKDGNYNLAVYGNGTITVDIDGVTRRTVNLVEGVAHNETVSLGSGIHSIEITANNRANFSYLDSIFIASTSTENGQPLLVQQQHDSGREEAIIGYDKIDPTNYKVTIKAQSPFMLAFAEAYDERWIAEVKEISTGIKKTYDPLPLYGAINGFMIDEEGEYEVHIKYAPQEIFYIGALISAVSYAFVITYLVRAHHPIFPRGRSN